MNTKIPGLGIAHLALKAKDFDKSYKFYTEGLGMTPYLSWGEGDSHIQMLKFGDGAGILELFAGGSDELPEMGKYIHFAYSVEDVDAAYETALAAGAKPLTPAEVGRSRKRTAQGHYPYRVRNRSGRRTD